jgi:hypothetical protein
VTLTCEQVSGSCKTRNTDDPDLTVFCQLTLKWSFAVTTSSNLQKANSYNFDKHLIFINTIKMATNFSVPDGLEDLYRDVLTAGPISQPVMRKRDRTKSASHGECTLELASQVLCGRVQSRGHEREYCPSQPSNMAEPSFDKFLTAGISGTTFIDMLKSSPTSATLVQEHNLKACPRVEGAETARISMPVRPVTTSKYTAAQIAERKALKKQRQIQERETRRKELQADKLLLAKQAPPVVQILEQVLPPDPLVVAETPRQAHCLPAGRHSHELPHQTDISQTTPPPMHNNDPAVTPVKTNPMLLQASEDNNDPTWLTTIILQPTSPAFWMSLFGTMIACSTRQACSLLTVVLKRIDHALREE